MRKMFLVAGGLKKLNMACLRKIHPCSNHSNKIILRRLVCFIFNPSLLLLNYQNYLLGHGMFYI